MALPASRPISNQNVTFQVTAGAAQSPGDIVAAYTGKAGVVLGTENKLSGDTMSLALDGIWEVDCASATTASAGAKAYFNTSTKLIVTAGGGGIVQCGLFANAKTSGQTKATIDLNAIALS